MKIEVKDYDEKNIYKYPLLMRHIKSRDILIINHCDPDNKEFMAGINLSRPIKVFSVYNIRDIEIVKDKVVLENE